MARRGSSWPATAGHAAPRLRRALCTEAAPRIPVHPDRPTRRAAVGDPRQPRPGGDPATAAASSSPVIAPGLTPAPSRLPRHRGGQPIIAALRLPLQQGPLPRDGAPRPPDQQSRGVAVAPPGRSGRARMRMPGQPASSSSPTPRPASARRRRSRILPAGRSRATFARPGAHRPVEAGAPHVRPAPPAAGGRRPALLSLDGVGARCGSAAIWRHGCRRRRGRQGSTG